MARMVPSRIAPEVVSSAERRVFEWFEHDPATEHWIVLHSLGLARHEKLLFGEIDFVVLAPDYGIFSLEIKGGRVSRSDGLWEFTNRYDETNKKARGPFDQARDGMFSIMREIRSRLGQERGYSSMLYGYGAVFPDISFNIEGPDYDRNQIWDRTSAREHDISDFIIALSSYTQQNQKRVYGDNKPRTLPNRSQVRKIAEVLRGDFDRPMLLPSIIEETDNNLNRLTREQFRCLDMFEDNKRVVTIGSAGTGKTVLSIEEARRALENGEKVGYFCFNSALASWAEEQLSPIMTSGSFVGTFHSFMNSRYDGPAGDYSNNFFSHELPRSLIKRDSLRSISFDRIIIDEAQDLIYEDYLSVFDSIVKNGLDRGRWNFFGDFTRQAIFQRRMSDEEILEQLDSCATYAKAKLTINCRNTKNIGTQAKLIVGFESQFPDDSIPGAPVTFNLWHDEHDEARQLSETLIDYLNEGVHPSDIVILTPLSPGDSVASRISLTVPIGRTSSENSILLTSIQSFKGLESRVVIIADCTSYANFSLYYVGITRAKAKLCILENEYASRQRISLIKEHLNG